MCPLRYYFNDYILDTSTHELLHDLHPVALEPQVFRLLHYLIIQAPQLVTRHELTQLLWPTTHVSDAALFYTITAARRAIGDTGRVQRTIKTIYRQGYRWIRPITVEPDSLPPALPLIPHTTVSDAQWYSLRQLWVSALTRGTFANTYQFATYLLQLGIQHDAPLLQSDAHGKLGTACLFQGDFVPARQHFSEALRLHPHPDHRTTLIRWNGWTLWFLGYPAQALAAVQTAFTQALLCQHPSCLAYAHIFRALMHYCRREPVPAQRAAEALLTLHIGDNFLQHYAHILVAAVRHDSTALHTTIARYQAQGLRLGLSMFWTWEATTLMAHDVTAALVCIEKAHRHLVETGETFYGAEITRLHGELLQATGAAPERYRVMFEQALTLAQQQQARAWELRAATSLARYWQRQGAPHHGIAGLASILSWYSEGRDTVDLQDAFFRLAQLRMP